MESAPSCFELSERQKNRCRHLLSEKQFRKSHRTQQIPIDFASQPQESSSAFARIMEISGFAMPYSVSVKFKFGTNRRFVVWADAG